MSYYPTFKDGKKTIDFIVVYKTSLLVTEKAEKRHKAFLGGLTSLGLELENENFSVNEDIVFIKIHAPEDVVLSYAGLFDIDLACRSFDYRPFVAPPPAILATPLTSPNVNDPIYSRAPETLSGEIPQNITSAERIMVVYQILNRCIWGEGKGNYGIHRLIKANVFIDAFPLHDGDHKWSISGPLNDRQLLALYWGTAQCWRKAQPLNVIEKYFGTEYALYFAWLGLYIKMLVPAAIGSLLVFLYGLVTITTPLNSLGKEICRSDIVMCPRCHYRKCKRELLRNSCLMAHLTYLFDNWCAVVFSAIISLWEWTCLRPEVLQGSALGPVIYEYNIIMMSYALLVLRNRLHINKQIWGIKRLFFTFCSTVFMELWQRNEAVLQLQWNVKSLEHTTSMRPQFIERATKMRYSQVTGKMEPYMSVSDRCTRYTITLASVTLLLCIMVLATFGVMVYRVTVTLTLIKSSKDDIIVKKSGGLIASVTGALMSGFFIFIFKSIYQNIALGLTSMENHRTQQAFNNAYIYKSYALAFTNNYSAVFYIAFFKGKFYTYPGDMKLWSRIGGLDSDICDPTGCIVDLAILLIIIMSLKAIASNISQILIPKLKELFNKTMKKIKSKTIPQWEKEYLLAKTEDFFIVDEYMDMVIQYGFVNFFIMGFPLAPLFALLNNIAELRVDASKVTKSYRRPVPNKVTGLGAWFGILQAMTYIGVVTNALVIAFTSNFMEKVIYKSFYGMRAGFLNHTLSVFDMKSFQIIKKSMDSNPFCYYPGQRYPPGHNLKYQRRKQYWHDLGIKFATVVIFEHIVIIIKGLLAYAIPDVPFSVKQQLVYQQKNDKKMRMKNINQEYLKKRDEMNKTKESKKSGGTSKKA